MDSHNSEPIIIAEAVEKWYDNRFHALRGVNLTVNKQEVVVIMGPSGSGNTTLLRAIAGLDPPDTGKIIINGKDTTNVKEWRYP